MGYSANALEWVADGGRQERNVERQPCAESSSSAAIDIFWFACMADD
jgi:hypothetical protein